MKMEEMDSLKRENRIDAYGQTGCMWGTGTGEAYKESEGRDFTGGNTGRKI